MIATPAESPGEQYALAVMLPLIATVFIGLRFTARHIKRSPLMWDDWLVVFSLVFTYLTGIFIIMATALGDDGSHMNFTPQGEPILDGRFVWFLKMVYAVQLSQTLAIGPTKISVLLLYRRIFRGQIFNIITWVMIGIMVVWIIAFFFANMLECVPISESWTNAPGLGTNPHCIHTVPMYMAQVYTDVIMDVLILIVPIPLVWKLQLPNKQKIAVCGMFLLGIICAKMIVYYLIAAEMATVPDLSYFMTPVLFWPLVESSLQIVSACLPLLRPLWPSGFGRTVKDSKPSWYGRSDYSNETGRDFSQLGTISTSHPIHARDLEMEAAIPKGSDHDSDDSKSQPQEIYVHRSFNAQVSPARRQYDTQGRYSPAQGRML